MTKSSQSPQPEPEPAGEVIRLVHELELPDGSGSASKPYPVSVDRVLRLSEERLPLVNSRPEAAERRLKEKCLVPFEL